MVEVQRGAAAFEPAAVELRVSEALKVVGQRGEEAARSLENAVCENERRRARVGHHLGADVRLIEAESSRDFDFRGVAARAVNLYAAGSRALSRQFTVHLNRAVRAHLDHDARLHDDLRARRDNVSSANHARVVLRSPGDDGFSGSGRLRNKLRRLGLLDDCRRTLRGRWQTLFGRLLGRS